MYSDYTHFPPCETQALEPESKEEGSKKQKRMKGKILDYRTKDEKTRW
jgi:hypothetical protein